jgi:hypothetical protein
MIAAALVLFSVAWLALIALLLAMAWLAWRWKKPGRLSIGRQAVLMYTWPIVVVSSSTWQGNPEAKVARFARLSAVVSATAGAALLSLMAFV